MEFIIGLIIVWFIGSLIKQIISDHKEEILGFLCIVGIIAAIVICTIKFGFWNVLKFILIIVAAFFAIVFISSIISTIVEEYYDRKAIKTEKKVRNYVFSQPRNIKYDRLKDSTIEFFGRINLGKKHNVTDYIDNALGDFVARNANEIYRVIGQDIKERVSIEYNKYYDDINRRMGAYCLRNCSFKDWVDHCLNEFATKICEGGEINFIDKNVEKDKEKFFSRANYNRKIIDEDDEDDDYTVEIHELDRDKDGVDGERKIIYNGKLYECENIKRVIIDEEDYENGYIEVH